MLLKVLLGWRDHLQSHQFVPSPLSLDPIIIDARCSPSLLESGDDVSDESTLEPTVRTRGTRHIVDRHRPYLDAIRLDGNETNMVVRIWLKLNEALNTHVCSLDILDGD